MMTAADELRQAAALMRERADAATPGPWAWEYPGQVVIDDFSVSSRDADALVVGSVAADVQHIASWHPDVARAVADWLDETATRVDQHFRDTTRPSPGIDQPPGIFYGNPGAAHAAALIHPAFYLASVVARAYLGTGEG